MTFPFFSTLVRQVMIQPHNRNTSIALYLAAVAVADLVELALGLWHIFVCVMWICFISPLPCCFCLFLLAIKNKIVFLQVSHYTFSQCMGFTCHLVLQNIVQLVYSCPSEQS